ncbi:nuclear factor NF-kappa-B p105 subunit-like [Liolophura sinensis]|uniref:nuclear factor NF-kappa-B p105 subunit-like n=1 Tax=Liolophura sinensis TaxID=3198878 RepID=UPI0031584EFF
MADHDDSTCSSGGSVEVVNPETSEMTDAELSVNILVNNGLPVMVNGDMCTDGPVESVEHFDDSQPYLRVSEQPQSRGFRFRYKCEGPSHGGLQGVNSQKSKKTFPAVQIMNYKGPARIVVTLVTDNVVPKIHAHELVGKNCQNGICVVELKGNEPRAEFKFQNLGIMHVTKKNVKTILEQRILESMRLDQLIKLGNLDMTSNFTLKSAEKEQAKLQAEKEAKLMQLNVVKLCFQAYLTDRQGHFTRLLPSVLSDPIYDSKSPGAAALKICRMDKYGGCCTGNEEVFLLCEKVQKDDIAVRFVEADEDGNVIWEDYGNFGPNDVHRQFAIVFKTPPYKDRRIQKAVNVQIQLKRISDDELSDPKAFTYYPEDSDKEGIDRKRRKVLPGMGPSTYNPDEGRGDGGSGYGPGNGNSNGPFRSSDSRMVDTYMNYGGQGGQQFQYSSFPGQKVITDHHSGKLKLQHQQQPFKQNTPFSYHHTALDENNLQEDCSPFTDDPGIQRFGQQKMENFEEKSVDSVDAGFYSQEISSHVLQEESQAGMSEVKEEVNSNKSVTSAAPGPGSSLAPDPALSVAHDHMVLRLVERTSLALQEYAATGDIKALLLVQRHLTFMSDENGDLPLHLAIINKQQDVVKQLLKVMTTIPSAGRKLNAYNHLHQTPLHLAVLTQQTQVIDMLLKFGANPALVDRYGNTPVHLATKAGDEACVRALTKYLRPGVTQEKPFPELDIFNYEGLTPVHLAAASGNLNTLKVVCVRKADINIQDGKSGRTPLHYAAEAADLSLAGYLLLEANVDPNSVTFDNNTPLHIACGRGLTGMVALLMAAGANPDMENDDNADEVESDDESEDRECNHSCDQDDDSEKSGMKPRDLVSDDKKILRILDGEPYASIQEIAESESTPVPAYLSQTSFEKFSFSSGMESGISSYFGGLYFLDHVHRLRLSRLLDPISDGRDWLMLADKLGLNSLRGHFEAATSPTKALVDYLELCNGTFDNLRQTLLEMNRTDAVMILDHAMQSYQGELILNNSQGLEKTVPSIGRLRPKVCADSGISDLNCDP